MDKSGASWRFRSRALASQGRMRLSRASRYIDGYHEGDASLSESSRQYLSSIVIHGVIRNGLATGAMIDLGDAGYGLRQSVTRGSHIESWLSAGAFLPAENEGHTALTQLPWE
jgi:hypothetical protein